MGRPRAATVSLAAVALGLLASGSTASAAPAPRPASTGRLLVLLDRPAGRIAHASAVTAFASRAHVPPAASVPAIGLVTVRVPAGISRATELARLRRLPGVRSVQSEGRMHIRYAPNDPALRETVAGAPVEWIVDRLDLPRAWDMTHGGGALVGVVDTGVEASHPDLAGKIATAVDQAGAGNTADTVGHGTHVASLACGAGNNGVGIVGAGLDCRLVVEKADQGDSFSDTAIASSIVDATNRGVQAINLSLGDNGGRPPVQAIVSAIDYAYDHGVVVVAAAADSATAEQGQPADLLQPTGTGPDISAGKGLTVTSADYADQPSGFGNGSQISLAAYGSFYRYGSGGFPQGIIGAFPAGHVALEDPSLLPLAPGCGCRTSLDGDARYAYLQGTSMAAPQVAAVAAMVRALNPDIPVAGVIRLLKQTARRPAGAGWTPDLGWGILDAGAAVAAARSTDLRPPSSRAYATRRTRLRFLRVRWSGRDYARTGLLASGIARFEVYRSTNGSRYRRLAVTRRHSLRLRTHPGWTYRVYTIAVDRAGNREARPRRPDATTTILRPRPRHRTERHRTTRRR